MSFKDKVGIACTGAVSVTDYIHHRMEWGDLHSMCDVWLHHEGDMQLHPWQ